MAIQYSGNAQTSTIGSVTKQDIINRVGAALLAAGWTTVSGGTGTAAWKLQSATTPQGYAFRVLMQDNAGSCITFSLESSDGTVVGGNSTTVGGGFLLPGYTYRIACSKYQAFIWATPDPGVSRTFVGFGVPFVPSWNIPLISSAAWMQGNGATDADATLRPSFRTHLAVFSSGSTPIGAQQTLLNTTVWSFNSTGNASQFYGQIMLQSFYSWIYSGGQKSITYLNGASFILDALIFWGTTAFTANGACMGQLWDSFVTPIALTGDQTASAPDGHSYVVLTDNAIGSTSILGGALMVAIS